MLTKQNQKLILKLIPIFNETQVRMFVAKEVVALGRGGLKYIHELTGISRPIRANTCRMWWS